jgi:hypothetical protein
VNRALQKAEDATDNSCAELMKAAVSSIPRRGATGCKRTGSEKINGRDTVKWEMHLGAGKIQVGTWSVWVDPQLKMAVKWQSSDGSSGELENILPGPQPASLFVLPSDYRRQDLPR